MWLKILFIIPEKHPPNTYVVNINDHKSDNRLIYLKHKTLSEIHKNTAKKKPNMGNKASVLLKNEDNTINKKFNTVKECVKSKELNQSTGNFEAKIIQPKTDSN